MPNMRPHRSWLFVPGDQPQRFAKALLVYADAVVLDLEDSVADNKREEAIQNVDEFLNHRITGRSVSIWVRVDSAIARRPAVEQLARHESLEGFVIPKFENAAQCAGWGKPIMAIIETPRGVVDAAAITRAAAENLHGIALGPEDLCTALGVVPSVSSLNYAASTVAFAAHAAGVSAYACPGSIGDFKDLDAWRATLLAGRHIGSAGSLCIHPAQVEAANLTFSPTESEIAWAKKVCAAWEVTDGRGAIALDGRMIDLPIVRRARMLISRQ
jgi:citrate lyase subunit beta / citryl-CoA lyase